MSAQESEREHGIVQPYVRASYLSDVLHRYQFDQGQKGLRGKIGLRLPWDEKHMEFDDFRRSFELAFTPIGTYVGLEPYEAIILARSAVLCIKYRRERELMKRNGTSSIQALSRETNEYGELARSQERKYLNLSVDMQRGIHGEPFLDEAIDADCTFSWFKKLLEKGEDLGREIFVPEIDVSMIFATTTVLAREVIEAREADPRHIAIAEWFREHEAKAQARREQGLAI